MIKKLIFTLFSLLIIGVNTNAQTKIEDIPNPKINYGYVANPNAIISQEELNNLNATLNALESQTTVEFAVVLLNSIGDEIPKDYATALFNFWGIGKAKKDNGILLLFVLDQRRVEIETGYGIEAVLPDILCKQIEEKFMVPYFKNQDYGMGLQLGIDEICKVLNNPKYEKEIEDHSATYVNHSAIAFILNLITGGYAIIILIVFWLKTRNKTFKHLHHLADKTHKETTPISFLWWLTLYIIIPSILFYNFTVQKDKSDYFTYIYFWIAFVVLENRIRNNHYATKNTDDLYKKYLGLVNANKNGLILNTLIFPFPLLFYYIFYRIKISKLRNSNRQCGNCKGSMIRLDEITDNSYLEKYQNLEELIKSVDYDVWLCNKCDNHLSFAYINQYSKFNECSACHARTNYLSRDITINHPTYISTGLGRRYYNCKNCNHKYQEDYSISRLEDSSSSSSSSGSSSSSDSWGGGSSGGGGAGSSW